jgi:hypothetical protein
MFCSYTSLKKHLPSTKQQPLSVQVVLTTDEVVGSKWNTLIIIHSVHQSYM